MFSVVIPIYNSRRYINRALRSVCAQDYLDYEIIVIDNGSTDDSFIIAKRWIETHPEISAKCIRLTKNRGPAGGRNAGINAANGDYIAFLDADDYWLPRKLSCVQREIAIHSDMDVFYHWEYKLQKKGRDSSRYREIDNTNAYRDLLINGNCLSTSALCVKTDTIKRVGGFDERYCKGEEDYDCWLRMAKAGASFWLIKDVLGTWTVRDDSLSAKHVQHCEAVLDMLKYHYRTLLRMGMTKKEIQKLWMKKRAEQYCYLGRTLSLKNETKCALHYYKKSIKIDPFFYKSYCGALMSVVHV